MYLLHHLKNGCVRKKLKGKAFDNAVKQVINVHARCYKESGLEKAQSLPGTLNFYAVEFQNFTNAAKAAKVVIGINKKIKKKILQSYD